MFHSKIALIAVVAVSVQNVAAKTLAWYHFDDTPGAVRELGYEYPNAIDSTKYPARLSTFVQSWGGTFIPLAVTEFLPEPCNVYKDGVDGTPVVNVSALSHTYDPVDSDDKGGGIIAITEGPDDQDLHIQTGTVECFMKTTASGHYVSLISRHNGSSDETLNIFTTDGKNVRLSYEYVAEDGTKSEEMVELSNVAYRLIGDGLWHHIAFTVDRSTRRFELYVDYRLIGGLTLKGALDYCNGAIWCFGGKSNGGWKCGGSWDEIRFSDTVLPRKSMLRFGTSASDGETLLHYSFDGNCMPDTGVATFKDADRLSSDFADGKLVYEPFRFCGVEDGRGNMLHAANKFALQLRGTKAEFMISNANLRCYSAMTIEFFMKADPVSGVIPVWGDLIQMTGLNDWNWKLVFRVQRHNNSIYTVIDNPTEKGGELKNASSSVNLYDGKWHHVAIVIKPGKYNGNPTEDSTLYIDYMQAGYKSQMGTAAAPANLVLVLGDPEDPGSISHLGFDELRVRSGALPVEKFQRRVSTMGMTVILQ